MTFRDLSAELTGIDRFLPVHADDERIMIYALEYDDKQVAVSVLRRTARASRRRFTFGKITDDIIMRYHALSGPA